MDDLADLSLHCDSRCFLCVYLFFFSCSGSFLNMYDFKIKLKMHVLGNKALFISIFLTSSLSFDFFLFLTVTCRYGSHNSPLNNTKSHEIYGLSRARADLGVVQVCGPWEARTKSPKCLGHMKQRARAGLGVIRVYGPWEVHTKSPKFLGHMKPPSSSRDPCRSKSRESVGNPTTSRASLQDFFDPYRRHRARS